MPDITMCPGGDCPMRHDCYRHTAEPSERQSYFVEPPWDGEGCSRFWPELMPAARLRGGGHA